METTTKLTNLNRIAGSLIGGAIGDALGAPVEFMSLATIRKTFGPSGISDFAPAYGRLGAITDDTQMTLFTAEGLLRAYVRANLRGIASISSVVCSAYRRWLETQTRTFSERDVGTRGWLYHVEALWSPRAPGNTCLSALRQLDCNTDARASNDSKGAGGIMRVGPVAMMFAGRPNDARDVFWLSKECAWLTHGHPSGFLSAAAFSVLLHALLCQKTLTEGISLAREFLVRAEESQEILAALDLAVMLANAAGDPEAAIREIGEAWVGEEALGVAIFCAMRASDFEAGLRMAVNHDGDSDTTGLLVGQLLGASCGLATIPARWLELLEMKDEILLLSRDIAEHKSWNLDEYDFDEQVVTRYPGG